MKQIHENIQNLYKNDSQIIKENQKSFCYDLSQDHNKQEKNFDATVKHVEKTYIKEVPSSDEIKNSVIKKIRTTQEIELLLNKMAQILHESRPSSFNLPKTIVDEIVGVAINSQREEHKLLVEDACKRLKHLNDQELISKLVLFLENKNTSTTGKIYQYELLFLYHGAIITLIEKYLGLESQTFVTQFANTYKYTVLKVYKKYEKILSDAVLLIEDKKTRIKFQCFENNRSLYKAPQYKYEMMFMIIGLIYGAGEILTELVNEIKQL